MSVRAWKRVITLVVILIIVSLTAGLAMVTADRKTLENEFDEAMKNEHIVDLSEYGQMTREEMDGLFGYFGKVKSNGFMDYQTKYTDLYVENDFQFTDNPDEKICYLTFDDGPDRNNTARILDTLKEYDVKATFFVIYKDYKEERELYKRIVEEGHTIGVHTASHNYNKIYASVDAYLDDFERCSDQVEQITGVKPEIFRFPGGSVNSYNVGVYMEIIAEMTRRGYTYYDWNIGSGDASASYVASSKIVDNVLNTGNSLNKKIVLFHDGTGHKTTADALPQIIEGLLAQGYKIEALTKDVEPVCFGYMD